MTRQEAQTTMDAAMAVMADDNSTSDQKMAAIISYLRTKEAAWL